MKKLVIVESPTKVRSLQSFLDKDFKVVATKGHIIDLPKKRLGIDISHAFEPEYEIINKTFVKQLRTTFAKYTNIYLGTDPDREGEFISYSVQKYLKKNVNVVRIRLKEISRDTFYNELNENKKVDLNIVHSQQTRRIIDRLIGYKISPILSEKIKTQAQSAGRVQSLILNWICDLENEIINFQESSYWKIKIFLEKNNEIFIFQNEENILDQKQVDQLDFIITQTKNFRISSQNKIEKTIKPHHPFKTSTLQEECFKLFKFPSEKTMRICQNLYEGVLLNGKSMGIITYPRTDSIRIESNFQKTIIRKLKELVDEKYIQKELKIINKIHVQDAHEAIRPVDVYLTPLDLQKYLKTEEMKVYQLIWETTLAYFLIPAKIHQIVSFLNLQGNLFSHTQTFLLEDGFTKFLKRKKPILSETKLLNIKDNLDFKNFEIEKEKTKPPVRYNEGKIISKLDKKGIGRPSTYSQFLKSLLSRNYILKTKESLFPTELGIKINYIIQENFQDIINDDFTKKMEEDLDLIAIGKTESHSLLNTFYLSLSKDLKKSEGTIIKNFTSSNQRICPSCKEGVLFIKTTRKKKKYSICSKYPHCIFMEYI